MIYATVKRKYTKIHLIKKGNNFEIGDEAGANFGKISIAKNGYFLVMLKGKASQVKGILDSGILYRVPGLD